MAKCKECLHVEVCRYYTNELAKANGIPLKVEEIEGLLECGDCEHFKSRSQFVELPCKKDDVIFCNNSAGVIIPQKVTGFIIRASGTYVETDMLIHESAIGDFVFLTREEAEQALKEREA